jgi:hypothetical protein
MLNKNRENVKLRQATMAILENRLMAVDAVRQIVVNEVQSAKRRMEVELLKIQKETHIANAKLANEEEYDKETHDANVKLAIQEDYKRLDELRAKADKETHDANVKLAIQEDYKRLDELRVKADKAWREKNMINQVHTLMTSKCMMCLDEKPSQELAFKCHHAVYCQACYEKAASLPKIVSECPFCQS